MEAREQKLKDRIEPSSGELAGEWSAAAAAATALKKTGRRKEGWIR